MEDLACFYGFESAQNMYPLMFSVVDAINSHSHFTFDFPLTEEDKLRDIAAGFARKQPLFDGCCGCLDGVLFRMKAVPDRRFMCKRKKMWAILAQVICDHRRRFLWADFSHTSTTHDSGAFKATTLAARIASKGFPPGLYLLGDHASALSPYLLTPTGTDKDFDYFHSSVRITIECAFGLLVRRWGVLWRALEIAQHRRSHLVACLMRLHNFCIDEGITLPTELASYEARSQVALNPDVPERRCVVPSFSAVDAEFDDDEDLLGRPERLDDPDLLGRPERLRETARRGRRPRTGTVSATRELRRQGNDIRTAVIGKMAPWDEATGEGRGCGHLHKAEATSRETPNREIK